MRIGPIEIAPGAALAPMAGCTDVVMRDICARHGAVFTVSEMVSAMAITMNDKKSLRLLHGRGGKAPYGVQLFGADPAVMAKAAAAIENEDFDFLDINMGCPVQKVAAGGAGSGLLRDPARAGEMVRLVAAATSRPVTVKLRIGWDEQDMRGAEVAKRCEDAGAVLLAVHARTRAELYKPGVHPDAVKQIKNAVSVPVLYNGDVDRAETARAMLAETGCDGAMIGRAAIGNPFVFTEVSAALAGEEPPAAPPLTARFALLDEQVRAMCEEMGEDAGMRKARGVAAAYMKCLRGAAALRHQAHSLAHYTDLAGLISAAYEQNHEEH